MVGEVKPTRGDVSWDGRGDWSVSRKGLAGVSLGWGIPEA